MPPAWRRGARLLLSAYVGYLLLGNLALNTPFGTWAANLQPEKFQADWRGALTLWPGQVRVWQLRIRGHVRHMLWAAQADVAHGRVAFWPLLQKEIRIPVLRAEGVTGGVNIIDSVRSPPAPRPGGWTLRFDRIETGSLRHANLDRLVLLGPGRANAGFVKQMRSGPMQVLPSELVIAQARLMFDDTALLHHTALTARVAIAQHRRADAPGARKIAFTDATLELDGQTAGLAPSVDASSGFTLRGNASPGEVHARLRMLHGELQPGGEARLTVPVTADVSGRKRAGVLRAALAVTEDSIALNTHLASDGGSALRIDADLHIAGREVPPNGYAGLLPRSSGRVVADVYVASLDWMNGLIAHTRLLRLEGAGQVQADVTLKNGTVAAGSRIIVPQVDASAELLGNLIRGHARAEIVFESTPDRQWRPRLDAVMEQFLIAPAESPQLPYVEGRDLHLQLSASGRLEDLPAHLHGRVRFKDARVPDLRVYNRYLPGDQLRFEGGSGLLSGDLAVDAEGDVAQGTLRLHSGDARMRIKDLTLQGDVDINTRLRRADLDRHQFVADGSTVALRGVHMLDADSAVHDDWWADIELGRARLDWDKPLRIDGTMQVKMQDLSLLLDLFGRRSEYPKWVAKLIDAGEAQASGTVQWKDQTLVLDEIVASNQRFDVLARLRMQGQRRSGDLYARWGVLSVAVDLEDGRKDFHLVGARRWYDAQPALLR